MDEGEDGGEGRLHLELEQERETKIGEEGPQKKNEENEGHGITTMTPEPEQMIVSMEPSMDTTVDAMDKESSVVLDAHATSTLDDIPADTLAIMSVIIRHSTQESTHLTGSVGSILGSTFLLEEETVDSPIEVGRTFPDSSSSSSSSSSSFGVEESLKGRALRGKTRINYLDLNEGRMDKVAPEYIVDYSSVDSSDYPQHLRQQQSKPEVIVTNHTGKHEAETVEKKEMEKTRRKQIDQLSDEQKNFVRTKFSKREGCYKNECIYCGKVVASAHVTRWASHFRSCPKVPDADKTIYYSYYRLRASDCDKTTQDNACDNPNECQSDNLNEHHAENDNHHVVQVVRDM